MQSSCVQLKSTYVQSGKSWQSSEMRLAGNIWAEVDNLKTIQLPARQRGPTTSAWITIASQKGLIEYVRQLKVIKEGKLLKEYETRQDKNFMSTDFICGSCFQ